MENTDLEERLKKTDVLLSTLIQTLNNPKNAKEEVEALAKAVEGINTAQNEISGLISKEKALIENFKPVYEVRNYNMNVKDPMLWVLGSITVCVLVITFFGSYVYESNKKDNYYTQYRWLMYFGDEKTIKVLKDLDASYTLSKKNTAIYKTEVSDREQAIKEKNEADANAKLQKEKADQADKEAMEAAKKLH